MAVFVKKIINHLHEKETVWYPFFNKHTFDVTRTMRELDPDNLEESINESIRRSKRNIKDYARNNEFEYFVTFTFNPSKYNSKNIDEVLRLTSNFLKKLKRKCKDIKYLLVPEYHKDKEKIHLHGFFSANFDIKETNEYYHGKMIYNVLDWKYGFSTAVKINKGVEDILKCASYITKYVTKDLICKFNRKRYWCSKNLNQPEIISEEFEYINSTEELYNKLKSEEALGVRLHYNEFYVVQTETKNLEFNLEAEVDVTSFEENPSTHF